MSELGCRETLQIDWCCVQVFISVAFILGDGLFNVVRIVIITIRSLMAGRQAANSLPVLMSGGQHTHSHATEASGYTDGDAGTNVPLPAGEEGGEPLSDAQWHAHSRRNFCVRHACVYAHSHAAPAS